MCMYTEQSTALISHIGGSAANATGNKLNIIVSTACGDMHVEMKTGQFIVQDVYTRRASSS